MTKSLLLALLHASILFGQQGETSVENPLLREFDTPFGVPPFEKIENAHFAPAFERAIEEHRQEVKKIAENEAAPTFENTVVRLEQSGQLLNRVQSVFYNLTSAHTNDDLQALAKQINPQLASHRDDIYLNQKLFERIKSVYESRTNLDLTVEQGRLLEETYRDFARGGANLPDDKRARFRAINEELSLLSTRFGDNLLEEMNSVALLIEDEDDLVGLPADVRQAAASTAASLGHEGKWAFTLQRSSWTPLLQYSARRDLREKLYTAYMNLCNQGDEHDNKKLASRMASLRVERAELLGYQTHAHYVLEENMAETPDRVYDLLDRLWQPALTSAKAEREVLQAMVRQEGDDFQLAAWDWWYYAEKVRKAKFDFDEQSVKPYLELGRVRQAAFDVANKLWGITLQRRDDVPVYHPDVEAWEVKDRDGSHLALFYTDYYARDSKRGGAWMNNYREQWRQNGRDIRPIVVNVCNFTKPASGPTLLSLDETRTLFHEFGHALHGMLAKGNYASLSGTNVPRDFVEFPSQMMENWALAPEVLPTYARHVETGEPIPESLMAKLKKADKFNQGFATTEYLAASLLDMDWHTLQQRNEPDTLEFEAGVAARIGLIPEIVFRYRSTYFAHIFSGGYSSGYYSYVWAEVLDADAFEAFKQQGLFNQELAQSYRENILEAGGAERPMELYRRFRGSDPKIEPLLLRRGLASPE